MFVGLYWQSYGWIAPGESISGIDDEWRLSGALPRLIYVKKPAPERDPELAEMLDRMRSDRGVSYKEFRSAGELAELLVDDLALLLSERFVGPSGAERWYGTDTLRARIGTSPIPQTLST